MHISTFHPASLAGGHQAILLSGSGKRPEGRDGGLWICVERGASAQRPEDINNQVYSRLREEARRH
ncbi:hypothetical protein SAMN05444147_1168 [Pectobacterium carotovorum]|nr:hypothetical protein SAMN05444147_1168 [Pectobacterium carotovorum]